MIWIIQSFLSAIFLGVSVIFQKLGAGKDKLIQISAFSNTAALLVMLITAYFGGGLSQLTEIPASCWWLTILSGVVQTFSWITFFAALRAAEVNIVMAFDKVNIVVTMALGAWIIGEEISLLMMVGTALILLGTVLMTELEKGAKLFSVKNAWLLWAIVSPTLQAISNILAKLDTAPIDTALTTTLRMFIVVVFLWLLSFIKEGLPNIRDFSQKRHLYLFLGGAMIGSSYLLMYRAIYLGVAVVVMPIVKSSMIVSAILARVFLKEKLSKKGIIGFLAVCVGVALFVL